MSEGARVLVVDDEPAIRRLLRTTLAAQGYEVLEAADAAGALAQARGRIDAIILDLGLPDRDGLAVIAELRRDSAVPILVLSSRDQERGKVEALDAGADDYITKPFGAEELLARIRAALRHRLQQQGTVPVFESSALRVDLVRRLVTLRGAELKLSPKEYDILAQLVLHAGKVLTHRHLLEKIWGSAATTDVQYLRVYMRQLRQKIEDDPNQPKLIITEPGVGYRLRA
ncbi:MAG TPA: response regulator transcription factor [Nevskiaceae bacterium]|nr:response regulator transcription factor [Nevskiaceae bacterium]